MKKIILLCMLYLFTACSNLPSGAGTEQVERDLFIFFNNVVEKIEEKDFSYLRENMLNTKRNQYIYQELSKTEGEDVQFFLQEPKYHFPKAEGMAALQFQDRTVYFTVFYEWRENRWWIARLEERG